LTCRWEIVEELILRNVVDGNVKARRIRVVVSFEEEARTKVMKPMFTVHAGEYLVGSYIEQHYKGASVWVPSRDTGVDLLVSDRRGRSSVSIQVKFGKDFLPTHMGPEFQEPLRVCSFFTINRDKLRASPADFWVFVLNGFKRHSQDYVIVPTRELGRRLRLIHKPKVKMIQSYLWVTERNRCWEARSLQDGVKDERRIAAGVYANPVRDFTKWLNEWGPLIKRVNR